MYEVKKYQVKYKLIRYTGEVWIFNSLHDLSIALRDEVKIPMYLLDNYVGINHSSKRYIDGTGYYAELVYEYIVRTNLGDVVYPQEIYQALPKRKSKFKARSEKKKEFKFREGVVPFTGGKYSYKFLRHNLKTLNEKKQTLGHLEDEDVIEYDIKIRPKRNPNNIPDTRWDLRMGTRYDRNWKNYRNTQWKN